MDGDLAYRLAELRGQIGELGSAIRQLQRAGLDSASSQLLLSRKRGELEYLTGSVGKADGRDCEGGVTKSAPSHCRWPGRR